MAHLPATAPLPTAPAPRAAAPTEELTTFSQGFVNLNWSSDGWRLTSAGATLKDFGRREPDAEESLSLIRELRLNQRGVVGGPSPTLEYWLSDGRPPQAPPPGFRVQAMDGPTLRVERTQNQWVLRDDRRVLFNFGNAEGDARQALSVVRKYGFTHVGVVNPAAPAMMVFFAEPDAAMPRAVRQAFQPDGQAGKPDVLQPSSPVVAPAIAPLRQAAVSGHVLPSTSSNPDRTPFDYRQVRLRQDHGNWKLAAGSFVVADFGGDERAARLGLSAMQNYRFTERCSVGAAPERFSYLLAGGQAPRGTMFGVYGQSFKPERLELRQVAGRWAVCAGDETLVKMGERREDARQVMETMRRLQCDRLCRLGTADGKGMTFLVRAR